MTQAFSLLRRPPALRRSWQFVPGMDQAAHQAAVEGMADVVVADLEEFTLPEDRPVARQRLHDLFAACKAAGKVAAVRINKLEEDGHEDLAGIMAAAPQAILLPHSEYPEQIAALDAAISQWEEKCGLTAGQTEIIPTLESALALVNCTAVLRASPRVSACLLAAEDLSADLWLERSATGTALYAIRQRFVIECRAAGVLAIDCPFNFKHEDAFKADLAWARSVGLQAKCVVNARQTPVVHEYFSPSMDDVAAAEAVLAKAASQDASTPDAEWVDGPVAATARRVVKRAALFAAYEQDVRGA
ncbi:MAG: HpcH/HpaI aldolase/citrate lyase family protein [Paenalcaligenes sp.]